MEGKDFFHLGGSLQMFSTERAGDDIGSRGYSDFDIIEVGETIKRGAAIPIRIRKA